MNQPASNRPTNRPDTSSVPSLQEEADARDFAEFIARQDPLDAAAAGWVVRRQDGLTPEEEAELQEWLATDPAHARALEQVESVWGRMDELPDAGIEALKVELPSHEVDTAPPPSVVMPGPVSVTPESQHHSRPSLFTRPTSPGRRSWLISLSRLIPQAVVAFSMVGVVWYGWHTWQHQPTFQQSFITARGEQKKVNLPDGSALWLDTATRAEVALYRQRREVHLIDGQARFAVKSNPDQPFDVLAGDTRVTVVGTRFSVRRTHSGLSAEGSINVVVEEGRVRVASHPATHETRDADASVELSAGQSVTVDAAAGTFGPVNHTAASITTWHEGRINFSGTPLAQALAEFERYGNTGLVIRDPAVSALKVNGSFDLRQISAFTRALPRVLPVRLSTRNGQTEIIAATGTGG